MSRRKKEVPTSISPWKVTCRFNVKRNPGEPVCWWEVFRERRDGPADAGSSIEYEEPRQRYRTAELARMRADMLNGKGGDSNVRDIRTRQCDVQPDKRG